MVDMNGDIVGNKNTRDLRDPQEIGRKIIQGRIKSSASACQVADWVGLEDIPDVSKDDSMGKQAVKDYRAELEARAEEGDRYAEAALRDIDEGRGVQGFDDAGT